MYSGDSARATDAIGTNVNEMAYLCLALRDSLMPSLLTLNGSVVSPISQPADGVTSRLSRDIIDH